MPFGRFFARIGNMVEKQFEVCIRAIIQHQNKILVCWHKKKDYCFFPGGHLKFGESIPHSLSREVKEELGIIVKKYKFIGIIDNVFIENRQKHHEIDLVFDVKVNRISQKSKEKHLNFILFDKNRFSKEKILPIALQKNILNWLKNGNFFWASQICN